MHVANACGYRKRSHGLCAVAHLQATERRPAGSLDGSAPLNILRYVRRF